ncbi:serine protease [Roseibium polysiphoniae]|uniref:Serine protease n=1 Tax=Roseibium polysiphoniae TaxID=2571221 RepID=A0A944GS19_9HYPH|nr:serine protease [Roseibium polysiphoniae]MBS8260303.1 serine protease [Roseibium polysiphoniae]
MRHLLFFIACVFSTVGALSQEINASDVIENPAFQLQIDKTLQALEEIKSIYSTSTNAPLDTGKIRRIREILEETQPNTLSIYGDKVIYDDPLTPGVQDDRQNLFRANSFEMSAARSVALVVNRADLLDVGDGQLFALPGTPLGLCPSERFHREPAPGFCTSFRVGKDLIATAGHCIKHQAQCTRTSFVFGFAMESEADEPNKKISASEIYHCREIIDGELNGPDQSDWRVVRVGREMDADIPIASLRRDGEIEVGDAITIIGHPMGLPLKVTPGGVVRRRDVSFFVANPDTYGGNSGSPAFNTRRLQAGELLVEGILVRGEDDFEQFTPCMISKVCPENGCRGEDVTYASEVVTALLP